MLRSTITSRAYSESDLVKLDVLVGGEPVDALSMICHREQSYERAATWSRG